MARVAINTGATPNDGTGDNLRAAGGIINNNFTELYTYLGAGSTTVLSAPIWNTTSSGINTLRNVGLGTTNPRFALEVGSVGTSGTSLWVNGDARVTGILTIGTSSITLDGSSNTINVGSGVTIDGSTGVIEASSLVVGGTALTGAAVTFITAGSGISVDQNTGNVTITATGGGGGGESYWSQTTAGIHTLSNVGIGTTNPTSALTVGAVGASGTTLLVYGDARIGGMSAIGIDIRSGNTSTLIGPNVAGNASPRPVNSVAIGADALYEGDTVVGCVAIGYGAGRNNTGDYNTFIGNESGYYVTSGDNNVILGAYDGNEKGLDIRTSSNNVVIADGSGNIRFYANSIGNVGIGTTNPTSSLTVQGDGRFTGVLTATSFNGTNLNLSGTATVDDISLGGNAYIDYSSFNVVFTQPTGTDGSDDVGGFKFVTTNPGLPPTQETSLSLYSAGSYWDRLVRVHRSLQVDNNITVNGTSTFAGITTVTGNTLFTKQLNVSGVSTLSSNVSIGGTVSVDGGVKLATNNATIVGTSGTVGEIKQIAGAPFYYDGSAWREFVLSSGTPVSVPADTEWDSVVLRTTFDTDFTDAKFSASPVYIGAGSSIVGAAVTIGTGAFRNDGAVGSGVSYAYRSDYNFTGSWTIEFWMYVDSNPSNNNPAQPVSLVSMNSTTGIGTSGNWSLAMYGDQFANKYITWFNQNNPSYRFGTSLYVVSGATWDVKILDKWNHFALVRESDNGSLHFYVNGIEQSNTYLDGIIDNDILDISSNGLHFGGDNTFTIGSLTFNSTASADVIFDDVRISCGVGTAGQRYNSIGSATTVFTPPTTALPTTGTLSSYVQPPGDKYGEIVLGGSPTWRGTSGVTVSQQSSGNYRVSFASSYTNANDYYVLSQGMDQGFASYVGIARSITHVDLTINKQSDDTAVNTGALAVQIKNHI